MKTMCPPVYHEIMVLSHKYLNLFSYIQGSSLVEMYLTLDEKRYANYFIIITLPPSMKISKCVHHGNEIHEFHDN